jgi:hypothetical protein
MNKLVPAYARLPFVSDLVGPIDVGLSLPATLQAWATMHLLYVTSPLIRLKRIYNF